MAKRRRAGLGLEEETERLVNNVISAAGSALAGMVGAPPAATVDALAVIAGRLDDGLEFAERVSALGPLGVGVLAYNSLSDETRERLLGQRCADCGEPPSRCECCETCGFSPCACAHRFSLDVEGVAID